MAKKADAAPAKDPGAAPVAAKDTPPQQPVKFQVSKETLIKDLTNPQNLRAAMKDDTMEPHVHLAALLMGVFLLSVIIALFQNFAM